jgi:hypothetical protein
VKETWASKPIALTIILRYYFDFLISGKERKRKGIKCKGHEEQRRLTVWGKKNPKVEASTRKTILSKALAICWLHFLIWKMREWLSLIFILSFINFKALVHVSGVKYRQCSF